MARQELNREVAGLTFWISCEVRMGSDLPVGILMISGVNQNYEI